MLSPTVQHQPVRGAADRQQLIEPSHPLARFDREITWVVGGLRKILSETPGQVESQSTPPHLSLKKPFMDLVKYLAVSMILFLCGIWGIFLNRKNIIIMLMSIELMLLAVNLNFLLFSVYLDDLIGQLFALLVLTVAAAESAIGLALLVVYYRVRGTIAVEFINLIKG